MDNTLLIGLSQQMAMRRQMDIIANNIANMSTTAFKAEDVLFKEYPVEVNAGELGLLDLSFVEDVAVIRNLAEGPLEHTASPLDLAITGEGFFIIATEAGERYTRNGHFTLDGQGHIVTHDGDPLLGQGGSEFVIGAGETDITISPDGSVSTSAGAKGRVALVSFPNPADMEAVGASLYKTDQAPEDAPGASLVQGALEQSNVSPILEMTKMLEMVRAYQAVSRIMERAYELSRQAIQEMGEVPQG